MNICQTMKYKNYTEICATTAKLGEKNYNVTVFVPKIQKI